MFGPPSPTPAPAQPQPQPQGVPRGFTPDQIQGVISERVDPIQEQIRRARQELQQIRGRGAGGIGLDDLRSAGLDMSINRQDARQQLADRRVAAQQRAIRDLEQRAEAARRQGQEDAQVRSGVAQREALQDRIIGGAEGRVQELREDPTDQLILETLRGRISGQDVPFDDATVNALFSQASDQSASAAQAQQGRLRGRPGDASFESASREIMANRQLSNQQARQNIGTQRALTNFDAVTQALGQGGAFNQARNAQITDAERFLSQMLSQITPFVPDDPTFQDFLAAAQRRERGA